MDSQDILLSDQLNLLAGDFAEQIADLLEGKVRRFCLASRARRHVLLALCDLSPATARSALVRFSWNAPDHDLIDWALNRPSPWLTAILRRCMPATALPSGWYRQLSDHLSLRPRTGRVICQIGSLDRETVAVILALPPELVEQRLVGLVDRDLHRAQAICALWNVAIQQGQHPSNLRSAICRAPDRGSLETLLTKAVQADQLPTAPCPDHPNVLAIRTAKELSSYGHGMRNCMARTRGGFGLRDRSRAFFMWNDPSGEGTAMIAVSPDQLGWRLAEVRLADNRRPSPATLRQIAEAFEQVGIRDRPELGDLLMALA